MSSPRPLVFLIPRLHMGGTERVLADLVRKLDRIKYRVHVACLYPTDIGFDLGPDVQIRQLNIPVAPKRLNIFGRAKRRLGIVLSFRKVIKEFAPQTIFVPFSQENVVHFWIARLFLPVTYVASFHAVESIWMAERYPGRLRGALERWLLRRSCRAAQHVVVPGDGVKTDLVAVLSVPADKVVVIPNPLDIQGISSLAKLPYEKEPPFLKGRTLFVSVASLLEVKNHRLLLAACQLLLQQWDHFVVVCLGDGPMRRQIEEWIHEYGLTGHVFLLGEVRNPYPYMSHARGVLLTSRWESFGLVLAEAMACGAIPIAVDCPAGPRDVLQGGRFGALVPQDDPRAFASAMLKVAMDDAFYSRQQQLGSARVSEYDLSTVIGRWDDILKIQ